MIIGISNGWVKLEGRMPGDQARISCNIGFQLAGIGHLGKYIKLFTCLLILYSLYPTACYHFKSNILFLVLVCEENLSWSPSPPECVPVLCRQPPEVDNAAGQATGSSYKDKVVYTCKDGYEIRVRVLMQE